MGFGICSLTRFAHHKNDFYIWADNKKQWKHITDNKKEHIKLKYTCEISAQVLPSYQPVRTANI